MNSENIAAQDLIINQIKALIIMDFLNLYNNFESIVRDTFEISISNLSNEILQQLYFCYGGKIGSFIEYEYPTLRLDEIKYKKEEKFRKLSVIQIIKFFKAHNVIDKFNFTITSKNHPMIEFSFFDCAIKFVCMRNKIAHQIMDLQFDTKEVIEQLPLSIIEKEDFQILESFDISKMDQSTIEIASSIIYMRLIIEKLK